MQATPIMTRGKRAKHERPSRPLSAYNYFFRAERQRMLLQEPRVYASLGSLPAVAKEMGRRWKSADQATRAPFQVYADLDKKRYAHELTAWHKEQEEFCAALDQEEDEEVKSEKTDGYDMIKGDSTISPSWRVDSLTLATDRILKEGISILKQGGEKNDQLPCEVKVQPPLQPQILGGTSDFDEKKSFAHMAQMLGDDDIDYLLTVFGKFRGRG